MQLFTERSIDCHHSWWWRVENLASEYGWSGEFTEARDGDCFGVYKYTDASAASFKAALEAALPHVPLSRNQPRDPSWEFCSHEDVLWGLAGSQQKLQELITFLGGGAFRLVNQSVIVHDPTGDPLNILDEALEAARSRRNDAEHAIAHKRERPDDPLSSPLGAGFCALLQAHMSIHKAAIVASDDEMVAVLEQIRQPLFAYYEKAMVIPERSDAMKSAST